MHSIFKTLSRYHAWAYEILFTAVDQLSENDYFAEVGLAFNSIHRTLNHLYLCDYLWYRRFRHAHSPNSASEIGFQNYVQVKEGVRDQAQQWCEFIDTLPEQLPDEITSTNLRGMTTTASYVSTLLHVFNHGTHHRGQISAALTQYHIAAPEMDLYYYLKSR